jgi:hypothetical protein
MDKVTQQNAANSEESASAAEEMSSQAEELQGMVGQFALSQSANKRTVPVRHEHSVATVPVKHAQQPAKHENSGKRLLKKPDYVSSKKAAAESEIPLSDEVLKEF